MRHIQYRIWKMVGQNLNIWQATYTKKLVVRDHDG